MLLFEITLRATTNDGKIDKIANKSTSQIAVTKIEILRPIGTKSWIKKAIPAMARLEKINTDCLFLSLSISLNISGSISLNHLANSVFFIEVESL